MYIVKSTLLKWTIVDLKKNTHTHTHTHMYIYYMIWYIIYLLTAIGLPPGGSSTVHIYTQTVHRTTQ